MNEDVQRIIRKINLKQRRPLLWATITMSLGMVVRTIGQAVVFIVVARVLQVDGYGAYVAVLALAGGVGSLSGLGSQALVIRNIARGPENYKHIWGCTRSIILFGSPVILGLYLLLSVWVLPSGVPRYVILFLGLSEILFTPFSLAAVNIYQGFERTGMASKLMTIYMLPRVIGALLLIPLAVVIQGTDLLITWSAIYALAALIGAYYGFRKVRSEFGVADKTIWSDWWSSSCDGIKYALGTASQRFYTDVDKMMLARLDSVGSAGIYSAAYRITELALIPIRSLLITVIPRFFREGERGLIPVLRLGRRMFPYMLVYSVFACIGLYLLSDLIPKILGENYQSTSEAMKWLALFPFFTGTRWLIQSVLTGNDRQSHVVMTLFVGVALNIGLNILLIPIYGWIGVIITTFAVECLMAVVMAYYCYILFRDGAI